MTRSLLHVATDWPGHFPNVASTIATLVEAGADDAAAFAQWNAARRGSNEVPMSRSKRPPRSG